MCSRVLSPAASVLLVLLLKWLESVTATTLGTWLVVQVIHTVVRQEKSARRDEDGDMHNLAS